jgi:hypothetical protein
MFNLENKCDISFGFTMLEEVPVFITIFVSFVLGVFCAIPLVWHIKKKRMEKALKNPKPKNNDDVPPMPSNDPIDARAARQKFLARKSGG